MWTNAVSFKVIKINTYTYIHNINMAIMVTTNLAQKRSYVRYLFLIFLFYNDRK